MDSTFNFTSSDDEVIVAKSDDNGQAVGSKKLYQPFRQLDVAPDVAALQRPNEEKLYILLYYNIEYEEYKFAKFHGRYNTYFGIKNILDSESVDLYASEVLVETVGIDGVTHKARRFLMHSDDALNLYDFCKQMEKFFGDNAYSIEEYNTGYTIKDAADYIETHPEPAEVDYKRVNEMLRKNTSDEEIAQQYGVDQSMLQRDMIAPFEDAQEIGKQFITSANMGDVESKEI